jgi:hypothetical protein
MAKTGPKPGTKYKKTLLKEEARKLMESKALSHLDLLLSQEVNEAHTNWKVRHWLLEQIVGRAPINLDHKLAGAIEVKLTNFGKPTDKNST